MQMCIQRCIYTAERVFLADSKPEDTKRNYKVIFFYNSASALFMIKNRVLNTTYLQNYFYFLNFAGFFNIGWLSVAMWVNLTMTTYFMDLK